MSISTLRSLWDHRAVLYRATASRDGFNDVIETWAPRSGPHGKNCRPDQNWGGGLTDRGPGEQQGSTRRWFLDRGFTDVQERDVLLITEGPETDTQLRILSVTRPTHPSAVHHLEVIAEVWHGSLTEEDDE